MIRLADVLTAIIESNPFLQFGLQNRLLNLSQLSKYLHPMVEARARKNVTENAILMALSRIQRSLKRGNLDRAQYCIDHISIQTGLCTFTFSKTHDSHAAVHKLYTAMQKKHGYITITESTNQITVIVESQFDALVNEYVSDKPLFHHKNISSIDIRFDEEYIKVPGLIYVILQQTTLQGINIVEIGSTYTELVLYIDESDTKVAFDTLYALFAKENAKNL